MKIYLTYGFVAALCNTLLAVVLFFLGFHSDVEKLSIAQWLGWIGGALFAFSALIAMTVNAAASASVEPQSSQGD